MKTLEQAMAHAAHSKSVDACSDSGRALTILHDHILASPQAVTDEQIERVYESVSEQDLRPQDKRIVFAFARALLSAQPAATVIDYGAKADPQEATTLADAYPFQHINTEPALNPPKPQEAKEAGAVDRNAVLEEAARGCDRHAASNWNDDRRMQAKLDAQDIRAMKSATPSTINVEPQWRCFHCEEVFGDRADAAKHFGPSERYEPACQVDIEKYREMQDTVARYCEEDTDLHRQIYGLQTDIVTARQRAEEEGYARGLRDAAKYPDDIIKAEPTGEQL